MARVYITPETTYDNLKASDILCAGNCSDCEADSEDGCMTTEDEYESLSTKDKAALIIRLCETAEFIMKGEEDG